MDSDEEKQLNEAESLLGSDKEEDEGDWESYDGLVVDELSASELDDCIEGEKEGKKSKMARY